MKMSNNPIDERPQGRPWTILDRPLATSATQSNKGFIYLAQGRMCPGDQDPPSFAWARNEVNQLWTGLDLRKPKDTMSRKNTDD